jgi:CheY-like chemotaxis protein
MQHRRIDEAVAVRAYALWEEAGKPEGRDEEFWHLAERQLLNEDEGSPHPDQPATHDWRHVAQLTAAARKAMRAPLLIFVLEDEALIRMMIVQMLEELGHRLVFEAGNIREAMALATTADFDLAHLDVNVGGDTSNDVAAIVDRRGLPATFR